MDALHIVAHTQVTLPSEDPKLRDSVRYYDSYGDLVAVIYIDRSSNWAQFGRIGDYQAAKGE